MEPTRPAAADRVQDTIEELAGRLISRPLGGGVTLNPIITIRELREDDRPWVRGFLQAQAGNTRIVSRGTLHHADYLPGLVGLLHGDPVGLLSYTINGPELEVVTLHTSVHGKGVGTSLLEEATRIAKRAACHRLWLITTNDNLPAVNFYKQRGLNLVAVHEGAVNESRKLKPEIPLFGLQGIPITDELEFELRL